MMWIRACGFRHGPLFTHCLWLLERQRAKSHICSEDHLTCKASNARLDRKGRSNDLDVFKPPSVYGGDLNPSVAILKGGGTCNIEAWYRLTSWASLPASVTGLVWQSAGSCESMLLESAAFLFPDFLLHQVVLHTLPILLFLTLFSISRRQSSNRWDHPTLDFPPSKMWAEYTAF